MLEIPGIDPDKVDRYGKTFLKLVQEAHRGYEAMMQQQEDRPQDPNHVNVIDISSDDEFGGAGDLDEFDADEESLGESSRYFPSDDVNAFNAQRKCHQTPRSLPIANKPKLLNLPLHHRLLDRSPKVTTPKVVVAEEADVLRTVAVAPIKRGVEEPLEAAARAKRLLVFQKSHLQAAGAVEAALLQAKANGAEVVEDPGDEALA